MVANCIAFPDQDAIAGFCLGGLGLLVFGVVGTVAVVVVSLVPLSFVCSVWSLYFAEAIVAVQTGVISVFFLTVDSPDVLIDERPVILQAQLGIVTDGRFNDTLAIELLLRVAETR